jgi:phosphoribulokinase
MITCTRPKLVFKHMVELPHCECVFCSTQEEGTGRSRIYLIFKEKCKVYARNGIRGNWEEVTDAGDHDHIWEGFEQAVTERKVPSFVASGTDLAIA